MEIDSLILLFSLLLCIVILAMIPFLTRRTENFGVSIPEAMYDRDEFRSMRKRYAWIIGLSGVLLCLFFVISSFFITEDILYILFISAIFVFFIGGFLVYLFFHSKMKQFKRRENWHTAKQQSVVVDMKFRNEKLTYSNWWFILPGLIIAAMIAITFILYDKIPNQIPMHTDFAGNVRYDEKSVTNLLFLPGTQVFMLLLFLIINVVIKNAKQQVSAENPDKSKQQNILFRRKWSAYMIVSAILMQLMFAYMQFGFIYPELNDYQDIVLAGFLVIILGGTIFLSIKTGQGGSRINIGTVQEKGNIDRDDDRYWKLGIFYINRDDPAIFVEKRFGIGWTNNWAHPLSWVAIIGIIAVPIILTFIFI